MNEEDMIGRIVWVNRYNLDTGMPCKWYGVVQKYVVLPHHIQSYNKDGSPAKIYDVLLFKNSVVVRCSLFLKTKGTNWDYVDE